MVTYPSSWWTAGRSYLTTTTPCNNTTTTNNTNTSGHTNMSRGSITRWRCRRRTCTRTTRASTPSYTTPGIPDVCRRKQYSALTTARFHIRSTCSNSTCFRPSSTKTTRHFSSATSGATTSQASARTASPEVSQSAGACRR